MIRSYIREHLKTAAAYGGVAAILYAVAGLYGYTGVFQNMSYALLLIAFFGLCAWIWGFFRYTSDCQKLLQAAGREEIGERDLPSAGSFREQCYQEIIRQEEEQKRQVIFEYDEKKRDVGDYYTMWTHQIKTPIAALRLLLQGMEEETSGQALEELFKIEQYAEMALHYARLNSLSSDLLLEPCDICRIVKQTVKKYSVLFIGSGLSFSMEEFTCQAVTDEKWLSFVIGQILSNALKYTRKGGIHIYGENAAGQKMDSGAVSLVIEDTGIGISESDLPRIFERGFTGYNGRLDKKSTGIGLYLSRKILDRLSHTIRVESRLKEGTKVTVGFEQKA